MQRWISALVGLAVVVLAFWMVGRQFHPPGGHEKLAASHASDAAADGAGPIDPRADTDTHDDGGPLLLNDLLGADVRSDGGGTGTTMPDGSPVPPLPMTVSRQVRFGVVLVSYAGAQPSAGATRLAARSKGDAKILSDRLLAAAQQDFHAAVQQGDVGSADDLGQVKLGILEPAPEYVLFTLPVHGVGGPVDTPRGYWIVKRLE